MKTTIESVVQDGSLLKGQDYPNRFTDVELSSLPNYVIFLQYPYVRLTSQSIPIPGDYPFVRMCDASELDANDFSQPHECFIFNVKTQEELDNLIVYKNVGMLTRDRADTEKLFQVEFCTFLTEPGTFNGEERSDLIKCDGI